MRQFQEGKWQEGSSFFVKKEAKKLHPLAAGFLGCAAENERKFFCFFFFKKRRLFLSVSCPFVGAA
jgi:hypothetical protein